MRVSESKLQLAYFMFQAQAAWAATCTALCLRRATNAAFFGDGHFVLACLHTVLANVRCQPDVVDPLSIDECNSCGYCLGIALAILTRPDNLALVHLIPSGPKTGGDIVYTGVSCNPGKPVCNWHREFTLVRH